MWSRVEIKEVGKMAFMANYWRSVFVAFLLVMLVGGSGVSVSTNPEDDPTTNQAIQNLTLEQALGIISIASGVLIVAILLKIFIFNPLQVGCYAFFKENVETNQADLGVLKVGFQGYGRTFLTLFLRDLFLLLWTLLFIVPGLIKSYSYRMVPFIIADEPDLSPTEAITRSKQMMEGHKWNAFILDLSFIGWYLLGIVTLGLGLIFWASPYFYNTNAELYQRIK